MDFSQSRGPLANLSFSKNEHFETVIALAKKFVIAMIVSFLIISLFSDQVFDSVSERMEKNAHSFVLSRIKH